MGVLICHIPRANDAQKAERLNQGGTASWGRPWLTTRQVGYARCGWNINLIACGQRNWPRFMNAWYPTRCSSPCGPRPKRLALIEIKNLASNVRGAGQEMDGRFRLCPDNRASPHSQHFAAAGARQEGLDVASGEEAFHFAVGEGGIGKRFLGGVA